jgi:TolA-binding protein
MFKKLCILIFVLSLLSSCSKGEDAHQSKTDQVKSNHHSATKEEVTSTKENKNTPPKLDGTEQTLQELEDQGNATNDEALQPNLQYSQKDGQIEFTFSIKNQIGHLFTYHFSSTQRYDYIIKDANGNILRQLSKEQTFLKLPGSEPIQPNAELIFTELIDSLPKGTYFATFVLLAKEGKPKATLQFEIK